MDVQVAVATQAGNSPTHVSVALDGSTGSVIAKTSIRLVFDRFLLPTTTFRQSVCLQPVIGLVKTLADCTAGILLEPAYDPVLRRITFRQPATSLGLLSGKRYTISVFPPPDKASASGIRAFDGAPLSATFSRDFTTRDTEPTGGNTEPPPTDLCDDVTHGVLQNTCATSGCHTGNGAADHGLILGAAAGLDLSTNAQLRATALSHVAHQTQTGEHADEGESSPSRFGRAMPILDPGRPGNSYLLYKLLANADNGDPGSDANEERQRIEEIARLRAAVVVGMPMPPQDGAGAQVDQKHLEKLSAWILQGASTATCE